METGSPKGASAPGFPTAGTWTSVNTLQDPFRNQSGPSFSEEIRRQCPGDIEEIKEKCGNFEVLMVRDWISRLPESQWEEEWSGLKELVAPGGLLVLSEPLPALGSRLSDFLGDGESEFSNWKELKKTEEEIYLAACPGLESEEAAAALAAELGLIEIESGRNNNK